MSICVNRNCYQFERLNDIYLNPNNYLMPHKAPIGCSLPTIAKYMCQCMEARSTWW